MVIEIGDGKRKERLIYRNSADVLIFYWIRDLLKKLKENQRNSFLKHL